MEVISKGMRTEAMKEENGLEGRMALCLLWLSSLLMSLVRREDWRWVFCMLMACQEAMELGSLKMMSSLWTSSSVTYVILIMHL